MIKLGENFETSINLVSDQKKQFHLPIASTRTGYTALLSNELYFTCKQVEVFTITRE